MTQQLVLSLFPGIGLLDMAFEEEGFCVVRGPDLLWGGDIRRFHPPAGKFDGVIGGPPCQAFSRFRFLNPAAGRHGNLIPEFERVVSEARPDWFIMENVPDAPRPVVGGYCVADTVLNNRWLGEEQERMRRFSFGSATGMRLPVEVAALESPLYARSVNGDARQVSEAPFTAHGKRKLIGNGVPLSMGRAVAKAVKRALGIGVQVEGENER